MDREGMIALIAAVFLVAVCIALVTYESVTATQASVKVNERRMQAVEFVSDKALQIWNDRCGK